MNLKRTILAAVCGSVVLCSVAVQAGEDSTAALVGKLKSSDEAVRLQAIDQLGHEGANAADRVAPLADLLKDKSAAIRAHAASALGEIGDPAKSVAPALTELVKDSDETVRRHAVRALMRIHPGPQVMVPLCIKLLEDSDPGVRISILSAIAEAGPGAVPGLITALKNDKAAYWACLVLRDMGPAARPAVPALAARLQEDKRPEVRREAILALAAMDAAAAPAVGPIVAALKDEATDDAATYALGRIGRIPKDAEAIIRANAKRDDKALSTVSLWALARVHPDDKALRIQATEQLIGRLKDGDPMVRVAAARGLAALPPAPEITGPIWEKAFQNADATTVLHALDAMAALGPAALPRLIEGLKQEKARGQVAYIIGQLGPAAAPAASALAALIADKDERVANEAIIALAKIGPGAKEAVPALVKALESGENANSGAVVYALGKIGPDAAAAEAVLTKLLDGSDRCLAVASAWALTAVRPDSAEAIKKARPVLDAGLNDSDPLVRRCAVEALGGMGPSAKDALPALKKATTDSDPSVSAAAKKSVEAIGSGAVVKPRHRRLRDR
jgi:HEAT repeat protein